jgi:hypothetical protein
MKVDSKGAQAGGRGAFFTIDLVAALLLFLVILLTVLWLWRETGRHMNDYRESNARQTRLLELSTMLVKTQGNPPDWHDGPVNPTAVDALGLASSANVLDEDRLTAMDAADYENLRKIMGLGSEEFKVEVIENYSGDARTLYSIGATTTASETRVVRRYALFNGTRVELKLTGYYTKK